MLDTVSEGGGAACDESLSRGRVVPCSRCSTGPTKSVFLFGWLLVASGVTGTLGVVQTGLELTATLLPQTR